MKNKSFITLISNYLPIILLFLSGVFHVTGKSQENKGLIRKNLSENWVFYSPVDSLKYPAKIPGNIHSDLLANNLIANPFYSNNELALKWIENENWTYETQFTLSDRELNSGFINLTFEGLDTYAKVWLNNNLVLSTENMFVAKTIDIKPFALLKNELRIEFKSAIKTAEPIYDSHYIRLPADNDRNTKATSVFTRKAPYQYGWDWGPRLVGVGIWRPVYLELSSRALVKENRLYQNSLSEESAIIHFDLKVDSPEPFDAELEIYNQDNLLISKKITILNGENNISELFEIKNPKLWWPNGYGEPYLYSFTAKINSESLNWEQNYSIGFRTIELERKKDSIGESFSFLVNKIPVYIKGANYIPQDAFPSNTTEADHEQLLSLVKSAHMNMLRIWGGGIYESDEFYNLCDKLGIMVWQDFMFACSLYPADSAFLKNVETEADFQIKRLRDHASLALWCGNNEMNELWHNWGYQKAYHYSPEDSANVWKDYHKIFNVLLPNMISELNPQTAYLESSPVIGWGHEESLKSGDSHYWGVWWGKQPFEIYQEKIPRFSSEFGFQSLPHINTILSFTDSSQLDLFSDDMKAHQKSSIGNQTILDYLPQYYPEPDNFEEMIYISQLLQAYGMDLAFVAQRMANPRCMGTLYWQLNDCWPGLSWSSVDYHKQKKATHYMAQEDFGTFLLQSEIKNNQLSTKIVSDSLQSVLATLNVTILSFKGDTIKNMVEQIIVSANSVNSINLSKINIRQFNPGKAYIHSKLLIENKILTERIDFFGKPKNLNLPDGKLIVEETDDNEFLISSSPSVFHYKIYMSTKEFGNFEPNFFHLLPGEKKKVKFVSIHPNTKIQKEKIRILSLNNVD